MIKCVIWDLDNTIWDGILSENQDVKLKTKIIELIKKFNNRGIVNSICSKNDFETAQDKLINFNLWEYFIFPQINWNPKSENVKKIITSLHFREANVMFVDDNRFELEEVKSILKEIVICHADNIAFMEKQKEGIKINNNEAHERVKMYKLEEQRIKDQEEFALSKSEFLIKCNIRVSIKKAKEKDILRISDLVDRTNQINSTGIRYDEEKILDMIKDNNFDIFIAEVRDIYGDYGRSGLVIAEKIADLYKVSLLIVSCRLMGKGIAQSLLSYVADYAKKNNFKKIQCLYKKNKFNRQMILLYTMNGFTSCSNSNEIQIYELNIEDNKISVPEWINFDIETGGNI